MGLTPKARFTRHGYLRVVGDIDEERRLKLQLEEIAEILDQDKAVPVGPEKRRIHRAIYSEPDDECFIVVQDHVNGEVVTILPFSHHGRFVVDSMRVRKMAMQLAGADLHPVCQMEDIVAGSDTYCVIAMEVQRPSDSPGKLKTERLLRFSVAPGSVLDKIAEDETVRKDAEVEVMVKLSWSYPDGSYVAGFKAHFVSDGAISEFRWFEKDWTPRKD